MSGYSNSNPPSCPGGLPGVGNLSRYVGLGCSAPSGARITVKSLLLPAILATCREPSYLITSSWGEACPEDSQRQMWHRGLSLEASSC